MEGLRYMHHKHIAHRDLKPENILVAGDEIKIADFGLSNIQAGRAQLLTPCGTPDYVAPEVLANKGVHCVFYLPVLDLNFKKFHFCFCLVENNKVILLHVIFGRLVSLRLFCCVVIRRFGRQLVTNYIKR